MRPRTLWLRVRTLLSHGRSERELLEELEFHLAREIHRNVERGMTPVEARRAARRKFGSTASAADACRDERRTAMVEQLWRDLRHASRSLARQPGFTAMALLTLAIGIGANTALFSIADPLLSRPLPVHAPDELVLLRIVGSPISTDSRPITPYVLFDEIRAGNRTFAGALAAASEAPARMRLGRDDGSAGGDIVRVLHVSGGFFDVLGVVPSPGRAFTAADDQPGAQGRDAIRRNLAVMSHAYWQRRFGGRPDVIGRELRIDPTTLYSRDAYTAVVVGVAPRGFHGIDLDAATDLWVTWNRPPSRSADAGLAYSTVARLRPGVGLEQAQAEVDVLAGRAFALMAPGWVDGSTRVQVAPGRGGYSLLRERFRSPIRMLLPAAGFILLMACANVAALLLARGAARQSEIAVRLSLGGERWALARLLALEGLLLAGAGGGLALLVLGWVRTGATAWLPPDSGLLSAIAVDMRLLAFAGAVALLAAVLSSLMPAVWMSRLSVPRSIRGPQGRSHLSSGVAGLHRLIIPLQIAFALVLLVGAALFLTTLENLRAVDAGFDRDRLIQLQVDYPVDDVASYAAMRPTMETLLKRLESLSGVASVATYQPGGGLLQGESPFATLTSDDRRREARDVAVVYVTTGFFEAMGISIVAGHDRPPESPERSDAAVLSESLARHLYGRPEDAVGRMIIEGHSPNTLQRAVVGIARDVPHRSLRNAGEWTLYLSERRFPSVPAIAIRTTEGAGRLAPAIRTIVSDIGGRLQIGELRTFDEIVEASIAGERLLARLSGIFGALALLLAAIGIYGLIAYAVEQRTAEIGLRMALGARVWDVIGLMIRRVMVLVAAGAVLGLFGIWAGSRFISGVLFGVSPMDPLTLLIAVATVAITAAVAAGLPARRAAARIDPAIALRGD